MTDDDETIEDVRERKLAELQADGGAEDNQRASEPTGDAPPESASEPVAVSGASELTDVTEAHDVVLVDFYADWCGPCKMLEPVVSGIASETAAAVAKVDVDANQQLASQYGVRGVPTLVLFADGEPVERLVGIQQFDDLSAVIEQYSTG